MILLRIFLLFLIFPTAYANYYNTYQLDKDDVYLGHIEQAEDIAKFSIKITRNKFTPTKVNLFFKYKRTIDECDEWQEQLNINPGHYETRCVMAGNKEVCEEVWVPEKTISKKVCTHFEKKMKILFKKIVLDFKFAARLYRDKTESYELSFMQQEINSGRFEIAGTVLSAEHKYGIYSKSFLHKYQTVYFARR